MYHWFYGCSAQEFDSCLYSYVLPAKSFLFADSSANRIMHTNPLVRVATHRMLTDNFKKIPFFVLYEKNDSSVDMRNQHELV